MSHPAVRSRASPSTSPSPMRSLCSGDEKDVASSASNRCYGLVNANANVSAHRTLANIERAVAALRHTLSSDFGATQELGACAMRCFGFRFLCCLFGIWTVDYGRSSIALNSFVKGCRLYLFFCIFGLTKALLASCNSLLQECEWPQLHIDRPGGGGGSEGVRLTPSTSSRGAGFDPLEVSVGVSLDPSMDLRGYRTPQVV